MFVGGVPAFVGAVPTVVVVSAVLPAELPLDCFDALPVEDEVVPLPVLLAGVVVLVVVVVASPERAIEPLAFTFPLLVDVWFALMSATLLSP